MILYSAAAMYMYLHMAYVICLSALYAKSRTLSINIKSTLQLQYIFTQRGINITHMYTYIAAIEHILYHLAQCIRLLNLFAQTKSNSCDRSHHFKCEILSFAFASRIILYLYIKQEHCLWHDNSLYNKQLPLSTV